MSDQATMEQQPTPASPDRWAADHHMSVSAVPQGALNLNVDGRHGTSPLQGFGQLWRKTYRVRLEGVKDSPAAIMQAWQAHFAEFQPSYNHFYPPEAGIKPGEVMFIDTRLPVLPGTPGLLPFAAGVMILYADDVSFSVMTPEGFPELGWNTFSVHEDEDGTPIAQIQSICRAADPVYEFGFRFMGGAVHQERTWKHVLESVSKHYGVEPQFTMTRDLVDPKLQWKEVWNIWQNAALRTMVYIATAPVRWIRGKK